MNQRFPKSLRVKSFKLIQSLFESKVTDFHFPIKITILRTQQQMDLADAKPKILISVPKKNFKKAVDRNRIKRQIREAYRKNYDRFKIEDVEALAFVYVHKTHCENVVIEKSVLALLSKLKKIE